MNQRQGNYEKKLLVIMALLAIAVAGLLVWQSKGLPDTLVRRTVTPKNELGEIPIAKVDEAIKRLATVFDWKAPALSGKPVPLNKSILMMVRSDQLFDLYVPEPKLREPMTNDFLVENNLPFIDRANVGDLDPDEDGFSNQEEFLANTKPMDAASKPPATNKLFLKGRITNDYILNFKSSTSMQVARLKPEPVKNVFASVGKDFGFDPGVPRFKALDFQKKEVPDPRTGVSDVSELKILDTATNKEFVLIRGQDTNLAEYEAQFEYRLNQLREFSVKKGENFQLPGTGETYKVTEVEETEATISKVEANGELGPPIKVPMR